VAADSPTPTANGPEQPSWEAGYWELGAFLLHQQCWCWGHDIRRAAGNLLLEYGFTRVRPPESGAGSSRYSIEDGCAQVYLWGFGVAYVTCSTAIYVNRYTFIPRWIPCAASLDEVWSAEQLNRLSPPAPIRKRKRARRNLKSLLRFISRYEAWVVESQGIAYRRACLQQWHLSAILPERLAREWQELSWHVPDLPL